MSAVIVSTHLPEPAGASSQGAAWQQLLRWQENAQQLAFVYSRSLGGLIHTGQGQGEALRIIQVQIHDLFSLPAQPLHFLWPPGTEAKINV